jgi:hypothetical protein
VLVLVETEQGRVLGLRKLIFVNLQNVNAVVLSGLIAFLLVTHLRLFSLLLIITTNITITITVVRVERVVLVTVVEVPGDHVDHSFLFGGFSQR